MNLRLKDKVAVIVGAGQTLGGTVGNGRAIAKRFAEEGARLLLVDRDEASLGETVEYLGSGVEARAHVADIATDDGPDGIIAAAVKHFGTLNVLVNNVGIGDIDDGPADMLSDAVWDRLMDVNLRAAWRTIRAAIPVMRAGGSGSIVNISSLASLGPTTMLSYGVSKAALNRLTQSVAYHNAAHGIRCNAITPGLMDTPMAIEGIARREEKSPEEIREMRRKRVPMGRMGTAWDTAHAALYLASEEAQFVTGVILPVDGGASVKVAV